MNRWIFLVCAACGGSSASSVDAVAVDGAALDRPTPDAPPPLIVGSGQLDPSWGSGGVTLVALAAITAPQGATLQPSGRLVVAVDGFDGTPTGTPTPELLGFTSAGLRDVAFGSAGTIASDLDASLSPSADGSFYLVQNGCGSGAIEHRLVDGSLDAAYGHPEAILRPPVTVEVIGCTQGAGVDPQGRILDTGVSTDGDVLVSRQLASGAFDPSFGSGFAVDLGRGAPADLAIQRDGKIDILDGQFGTMIFRIDADGTFDVAMPDPRLQPRLCGFGLDEEGRALVLAPFDLRTFVDRYTTAGALDSSFTYQDADVVCTSGVVGSDGTFAYVGTGSAGAPEVVAVDAARTVETHYAAAIGVGNTLAWSQAILQPDGKVIAIGTAATGSATALVIARFQP